MSKLVRVTFTPTLLTSAYSSGDVLFATTEVLGALAQKGSVSWLRGISVHDTDDQKLALDLYFLRDDVELGTIHEAPDITDDETLSITGVVEVATGDYLDVGGASVAVRNDLYIPLTGPAGSRSIFVAALTGGTPTHTADGMVIDLWVEQQTY